MAVDSILGRIGVGLFDLRAVLQEAGGAGRITAIRLAFGYKIAAELDAPTRDDLVGRAVIRVHGFRVETTLLSNLPTETPQVPPLPPVPEPGTGVLIALGLALLGLRKGQVAVVGEEPEATAVDETTE